MKKILLIALCIISIIANAQNYQKIRQIAYNKFKETLIAPSQFILTDIRGNKIPLNKIKVCYLKEEVKNDSAYWNSFVHSGKTYKYSLHDYLCDIDAYNESQIALSTYQVLRAEEHAKNMMISWKHVEVKEVPKSSIEITKDSVIIFKKIFKPVYWVTIIGDARNRMGGYEQIIKHYFVTTNGNINEKRPYYYIRTKKIIFSKNSE